MWAPGAAGAWRGCGVRLCAVNQQAASSADAKVIKHKPEDLQDLDLDLLHDELERLLDEQWLRASVDSGFAPAPAAAGAGNMTFNKVKHVVGGFSVVVRLPEKGLAYRLQPMRSAKAGLTWVAFYMMLQEAAQDKQAGLAAAAADVLYRPDRSVVLGTSKQRASTPPRKLSWEDLDVAREFQAQRLRRATKRLVHFRHQLLKTSSAAYRQGLCSSAENCPISWTDGGKLGGQCVTNGLMFPSHWFWTKVGDPANVDDVPADDNDEDAARSHEGHRPPGAAKRMKGSELAIALLFRSSKTPPPQRRPAQVLVPPCTLRAQAACAVSRVPLSLSFSFSLSLSRARARALSLSLSLSTHTYKLYALGGGDGRHLYGGHVHG